MELSINEQQLIVAKRAKVLIKEFSWQEDDDRTDASMKIVVAGMPDSDTMLRPFDKDVALYLVDQMASVFTECLTIDNICLTIDGDADNDIITIDAGIHLAE